MLKQLVLTTLLSTGVATTTVAPVYNAPNLQRQATETTENYNLSINQTNYVQNIYNYVDTDNELPPFNVGTDYEGTTNIAGYNSAINVLGTTYRTRINVSSAIMVQNYQFYNSNEGYLTEHNTRILTILQIDSYNYNRNTTIDLTVELDIGDFYWSGNDYDIKNEWFLRQILTTTADWSNYINRQSRQFCANNIMEQIQDPNNNYSYIQERVWITKTDRYITDNITINLLPNATQYIVLQYTPIVEIYQTYSQKTLPVSMTGEFTISDITISGTNYIPTGTQEVVDIPGLMWEILAMPFAFVSQAFNLTLFPGTPYQVNISNLFLSIIAIFVFVWLISLFIKMKQ